MPANRLYPGKPDYKGPTAGHFTLLHHQGPLIERSHDVMERVGHIKGDKAESERPVRLRHIVYVPIKMIPKTVRKAYAKWEKAYAEWEKAYAKWEKADAEWEKAYAKWEKADADKLLAYLHKHVKDCRWNGKELVFDK